MKKYKFYLLFIIALVIYLFLSGTDNTKPIQVNSNVKSDKVGLQTLKQVKVKQVKKKQVVSDVVELKTEQVEKKEIKGPKTSYLQAYRDYHFFKQCYSVIRVTKRGEDLQAAFKQKITDSANRLQQKNYEPTQKQHVAFELFKNRCFGLMIVQKDSFNENKKQLKNKYQQILPLTDEEKNLYKGLELFQNYKTVSGQLSKAVQGKLNLENSLVLTLKKQISNLMSEMNRIKWADSDDYYENETKQLQAQSLQTKVNELQQELKAYRLYDSKLIQSLEQEHIGALQEMASLLKSNESPDILLLYGQILMHPYMEKKFNIGIFDSIKIYDQYLAMGIYSVGIILAACALNYPCEKDSLTIFEYCFNGFVIHKEACGKSVEDYMFTDVLGPNQLKDVENFITHVLKNYAKN